VVANIKPITVEEFIRVIAQPENADRLFELINGEMVEKVPTQLHALIASLFNALLYLYMQKNPIGWVFSEIRIKLADDDLNDRIPDIAVVLKAGRTFEADAPLSHMPDLAVEIQSPGQSDKLMTDKAAYYLANDARMVWIVYPTKRLVEVLTPTDRKLLTEADTLDGGDVLPGFTLAVRDIFAVK
jgi:Uma2 family endonuclease